MHTSEHCSFLQYEILMMQIQKDDIRNIILKVAREEFVDKGFKDTSMRTIAQKSEVGLSNIYNYFKNKDEIFKEVLSGLLYALEDIMEKHNCPEGIDLYVANSKKYVCSQIEMFVDLIDNYKEDFRLLLFKSQGSQLENFREEWIGKQTVIGKEYMKILKEKYPLANVDISGFFIHTMSSWFISSISELVMHDLTHQELEQFITEYMSYSAAGWKSVMNISNL